MCTCTRKPCEYTDLNAGAVKNVQSKTVAMFSTDCLQFGERTPSYPVVLESACPNIETGAASCRRTYTWRCNLFREQHDLYASYSVQSSRYTRVYRWQRTVLQCRHSGDEANLVVSLSVQVSCIMVFTVHGIVLPSCCMYFLGLCPRKYCKNHDTTITCIIYILCDISCST